MPSLSSEKKLVWLGFKNPQQDSSVVTKELTKISQNVGDFSTFQDDLDAYDLDGDGSDEDISNFTQFKTYLTDNGFSSDEADAFIDKIKNSFTDDDSSGSVYDEFEDYVENQATSYEELQVEFETTSGLTGEKKSASGETVSGVIFHDSPGVSKNGVSVPAGTTEIFGNRIEFSESDLIQTASADIVYSNLQISDTTPNRYESFTVSADIANNGSAEGSAFPQLKVNGSVVKSKGPITIAAGGSDSVSFTYSFDELVSVDVNIADLPQQTVTVVPEGLIQ